MYRPILKGMIFRKEFFEAYPIFVDTNKFIRAHEDMFNQSITDGLKTLVPARSTLSDQNANVGVTIKPTILEKQKIEYKKHSVETNPNFAEDIIEVTTQNDFKSGFSINESSFIGVKSGEYVINDNISLSDTSLDLPKSGSSISINDSITKDFSYDSSKDVEININEIIKKDNSIVVVHPTGTNNYLSTHYNASFVNIHDSWGTTSADTHFLNMATETKDTSSQGDYNVNHIESRFHFYTIGDTEVYSASFFDNYNWQKWKNNDN